MNCTDCILDGTDACGRGAGRAIDDTPCKDFFNTNKLSGACRKLAKLGIVRKNGGVWELVESQESEDKA